MTSQAQAEPAHQIDYDSIDPADVVVEVATRERLPVLRALTNEAFQADAFFKKPEYHVRFSEEDIDKLFTTKQAAFLLVVHRPTDTVCGSIYVTWEINDESEPRKLVGHFSAVSVPERFGQRGVGRLLVASAEKHVVGKAEKLRVQGSGVAEVWMEMGVINLRKDLFPWYENQGYRMSREALPHDEELAKMVREDMNVFLVLMTKQLV